MADERPAWGPAHCTCGCRKPEATGAGCPCAQCQPGPGINFLRGMAHVERRNQALMAAGRHEEVHWMYLTNE